MWLSKLLPLLLIISSCGIYSFSGSSIPDGMKTIEVPLWESTALVQGVSQDVTDAVTLRMQRERLKIVPRDGDAIISGTVTSYTNKTYDYVGGREDLNVKSYAVDIVCKVVFRDQNNDKDLFNGILTGRGVYDFDTENEDIGRQRAVQDLSEKIMINSLQGW